MKWAPARVAYPGLDSPEEMKRVVVSGATGFIGRRVVSALVERGDHVLALTRDQARARGVLAAAVELESWDPRDEGRASELRLDADAVVHLAGEQAVGRRWTASLKDEIVRSRVSSTEALVRAMERAERRPSVFVCASAVGYYGDRSSELVDERASSGSDFLAEVTRRWENAALGAEALGVRVVRTRFGIVLGRGGGALAEMVRPFRLFVGGPIGSGEQGVSWVHRDDAVSAILFSLDEPAIRGPVNVTSPHPITNKELATAIGKALNRPSVLPVPAVALRLRFGEGAAPLLTGQRAAPGVLANNGFAWRYPHIDDALAEALG